MIRWSASFHTRSVMNQVTRYNFCIIYISKACIFSKVPLKKQTVRQKHSLPHFYLLDANMSFHPLTNIVISLLGDPNMEGVESSFNHPKNGQGKVIHSQPEASVPGEFFVWEDNDIFVWRKKKKTPCKWGSPNSTGSWLIFRMMARQDDCILGISGWLENTMIKRSEKSTPYFNPSWSKSLDEDGVTKKTSFEKIWWHNRNSSPEDVWEPENQPKSKRNTHLFKVPTPILPSLISGIIHPERKQPKKGQLEQRKTRNIIYKPPHVGFHVSFWGYFSKGWVLTPMIHIASFTDSPAPFALAACC